MTSGGDPARAIVVRVSGPTATVCTDEGLREARIDRRVPGRPAVAGDRVRVRAEGDDLSIVEIRPRRTRLDRGDGWEGRPRPLAANADLLLITAAVIDPPLRPRLLDRYLVAAEVGGLAGALVITKCDLPHDEAVLAAILNRYRALGYPVVAGCAKDTALVEQVRAMVAGGTAVLAGHSGVGKSTLTAALTGVERATGAVSERAGTGRHTTTDPRLIPIPGGGAVIDTAGVRTFHLPKMGREDLEHGFREIHAAAGGCRFRGCAHDGDAGCAVEDLVDPERLESYRRLLHDLN